MGIFIPIMWDLCPHTSKQSCHCTLISHTWDQVQQRHQQSIRGTDGAVNISTPQNRVSWHESSDSVGKMSRIRLTAVNRAESFQTPRRVGTHHVTEPRCGLLRAFRLIKSTEQRGGAEGAFDGLSLLLNREKHVPDSPTCCTRQNFWSFNVPKSDWHGEKEILTLIFSLTTL